MPIASTLPEPTSAAPVDSLVGRGRAMLSGGLAELRARPAGQIFVLDALRSLAVLLVAMGHSYIWWVESGGGESAIRRLPAIHFGWTGVDLFFILSGYLIGRQLWREYQRAGTVDVGTFILRRGFRIWPLYVLFVIISSVIKQRVVAWSDWLFVSNYVGGVVSGGWSLSTEEQFYIVLPLAVTILAPRLGLRGWIGGVLVLLLGVEAARYWTASELLTPGTTAQAVKDAMYSPGHLHSEGLLVGALVALLEVCWPKLLMPARTARRRWIAVGILGAGGAVAGVLRSVAPVVLPYLSLALFYGALTVTLLLLRETRFLRLTLDRLSLYRGSRLSYGVYLNHFIVVKWIIACAVPIVAATGISPLVGYAVSAIVGIGASFACAALTFVVVEYPFLQWRTEFLASRRVHRASGHAARSTVTVSALRERTESEHAPAARS